MKDTEVVQVARYIFGIDDLASAFEIKQFVQQHTLSTAVDAEAEDQSCNLVFTQLTDTFTWTHNLAEEELPGYLPLGNLVIFLGKMLSKALNGEMGLPVL